MEPSTKTPFEEFTDLYSQIKDKFELLPSILTRLSDYSENMVKENSELKAKLKEVEDKYDQLKSEFEKSDGKISEAEKQAKAYKAQLQSVENQMSGLREMYEEMAQERAQDIEIQDLLAIYTILFEQVFAANPHTKILLLLQGVDKEIWTRDEFVKTTGFTPAAIIKALHDLRNSGIIELDESANETKLIKKQVIPEQVGTTETEEKNEN